MVALSQAEARTITMVLTQTNQTNQITIESYETCKIVSGMDLIPSFYPGSVVEVHKDGAVLRFIPSGPSFGPYTYPSIVLAGPATIAFRSEFLQRGGSPAFLTVEITPETYDVNRSITVGPGPGGAKITLECSTNLVNWAMATNGASYTNMNEPKFFRIKAERQ